MSIDSARVVEIGGLCVIGYSLYSALNGDYTYILNYMVPIGVPAILLLLLYYIFPKFFIQAREKIADENDSLSEVIFHVENNQEKWAKSYRGYRQRFLFIAAISMAIAAILRKGDI